MKKRVCLFVGGIFLVMLILRVVFLHQNKDPMKRNNVSKIEIGYYYDEEQLGEIVINEDGTARYIPDISSGVNYYGQYKIEGDTLTIEEKDTFFMYEVDNGSLILKKYKDITGEVYECKEDDKSYSYWGDVSGIIYRECGDYYVNRGTEILRFEKDEAEFGLSIDINNSEAYSFGKYIVQNGTLLLKGDKGDVEFVIDKGNLVLKYYWISGIYKEFIYGEKVFRFKFDDEEVETEEESICEVGAVEKIYYNDDIGSEVILYNNGIARYCPSIASSANFLGEYEIENESLIIRENESLHEFNIDSGKLKLVRYVDYQGNIHEYEPEEYVFEQSTEFINELRPGKYSGEEGYIFFDNKGNVCMFSNISNDLNQNVVCDKIQGMYEVKDDKIMIKDNEDNELEFELEDGKLLMKFFLKDGKVQDLEHMDVIFDYCYSE